MTVSARGIASFPSWRGTSCPDTNRRRAVRAVAPVAGLLAAGLLVWQGSYAAFSATTANTGDAWSTGTLVAHEQRRHRHDLHAAPPSGALHREQPRSSATPAPSASPSRAPARSPAASSSSAAPSPAPTSAALGPGPVRLTVERAGAVAAATNVAANCTAFPATGITALYTATLSALPTDYARHRHGRGRGHAARGLPHHVVARPPARPGRQRAAELDRVSRPHLGDPVASTSVASTDRDVSRRVPLAGGEGHTDSPSTPPRDRVAEAAGRQHRPGTG